MKWLFAVLSIVILLLAGLAIAPSFFDWNSYKEPALKQIKDVAGYDVKIDGNISLALLPSPRVYLEKVQVADPSGRSDKPMAAFEMLDVRVALFPLLSGQVVVNSVNLEQPQVALYKNAAGQFNFMTDKVQAMMQAKGQAEQPQSAEASKFAVTFDSISIRNGSFYYMQEGQKAPIEITQANIDVDADSLQGPFEAEGDLAYNASPVKFKLKTGEIDQKVQSTSLNLDASMNGAQIVYAGAVNFGDAPAAQGELSVKLASLQDVLQGDSKNAAATLKGGVALKGLVTANSEKASLKNGHIDLAGKALDGGVEVVFKPLSVVGAFKGQDIVDLDALLPKPTSDAAPFDPLSMGQMLPKTLEIPEVAKIDIALSVPGVIYKGQAMKGVALKVQNTDKSFAGSLNVAEIPGPGRVEAQAVLSFAEKSKSAKTETVIYSEPSLAYSVKGQTQNAPLTISALSGVNNLPLVKDSKRGLFDFSGAITPAALRLEKGIVNLDDAAFSVSGAFKAQKESARPLLEVKVLADALDLDALSGPKAEQGSAAAGGDPFAALKTLSFPYDLDFDLTVNRAVLQGQNISGLRIDGALKPNSLRLERLGADDFAGGKVNVAAGIGDLKAMSDLDLRVTLDTQDPYSFAKALQVDTASWPKDVGAVKLDVAAKGSLNALGVDATVQALSAKINAKGQVSEPMTTLKVSGLSIHVQHPNLKTALQNFMPNPPDYTSLSQPVDFKANVAMEGQVTRLSDIQAKLAGTSVSGALSYDGGQAVPALNGQLRIGDLVLQSRGGAAQKANVERVRSGGEGRASDRWSSAPIDTAWLHNFQADLDIAANSIVYETWNLSKPALKMTLKGGVLNVESLQAGLYDGQISGSGGLSSAAPGQPLKMNAQAKIANINMGALAQALSGTRRIQAEGDVSLDFNVTGQGVSQSALISSMGGAANLNGQNVILKGFDLAGLAQALKESNKPLPRIQQILQASTTSGETKFDTVTGQYAIQSGIVNITQMLMDGPAAGIVSKGNVNLPLWTINTTHTVTLKNATDVAPFDVAIKGPLDNPGNTFGSGLFDTFVRQKLQEKALEKLPDLVGGDVADKLQQFGILPQKNTAPAPQQQPTDAEPASGEDAAGTAQPQQQQPLQQQQQELQPEEAIQGLIKGLLR